MNEGNLKPMAGPTDLEETLEALDAILERYESLREGNLNLVSDIRISSPAFRQLWLANEHLSSSRHSIERMKRQVERDLKRMKS